ncbi:MAG TPA: hypothetical protein VGT05_03245 [Patescibacteria group bacterium]|nr:hypothetical protein [Patescibacteria group bacterium]
MASPAEVLQQQRQRTNMRGRGRGGFLGRVFSHNKQPRVRPPTLTDKEGSISISTEKIVQGPKEQRTFQSAGGLKAWGDEHIETFLRLQDEPDPHNPGQTLLQTIDAEDRTVSGTTMRGDQITTHGWRQRFLDATCDYDEVTGRWKRNNEKFDAFMNTPEGLAITELAVEDELLRIQRELGVFIMIDPAGNRGDVNDLLQDIDVYGQGAVRRLEHSIRDLLNGHQRIAGREQQIRLGNQIGQALAALAGTTGAGNFVGAALRNQGAGMAIGAVAGVAGMGIAALRSRGLQIRIYENDLSPRFNHPTLLQQERLTSSTYGREVLGIDPNDFQWGLHPNTRVTGPANVRGLEYTDNATQGIPGSRNISYAVGRMLELVGLQAQWQEDAMVLAENREILNQFIHNQPRPDALDPRTHPAEHKLIFHSRIYENFRALVEREIQNDPNFDPYDPINRAYVDNLLMQAHNHTITLELLAFEKRNNPPEDPYNVNELKNRKNALEGVEGTVPDFIAYRKNVLESEREAVQNNRNTVKAYKKAHKATPEGALTKDPEGNVTEDTRNTRKKLDDLRIEEENLRLTVGTVVGGTFRPSTSLLIAIDQLEKVLSRDGRNARDAIALDGSTVSIRNLEQQRKVAQLAAKAERDAALAQTRTIGTPPTVVPVYAPLITGGGAYARDANEAVRTEKFREIQQKQEEAIQRINTLEQQLIERKKKLEEVQSNIIRTKDSLETLPETTAMHGFKLGVRDDFEELEEMFNTGVITRVLGGNARLWLRFSSVEDILRDINEVNGSRPEFGWRVDENDNADHRELILRAQTYALVVERLENHKIANPVNATNWINYETIVRNAQYFDLPSGRLPSVYDQARITDQQLLVLDSDEVIATMRARGLTPLPTQAEIAGAKAVAKEILKSYEETLQIFTGAFNREINGIESTRQERLASIDMALAIVDTPQVVYGRIKELYRIDASSPEGEPHEQIEYLVGTQWAQDQIVAGRARNNHAISQEELNAITSGFMPENVQALIALFTGFDEEGANIPGLPNQVQVTAASRGQRYMQASNLERVFGGQQGLVQAVLRSFRFELPVGPFLPTYRELGNIMQNQNRNLMTPDWMSRGVENFLKELTVAGQRA